MSKILIVTSVGGHLDEIMELAPALRNHRVSIVVNDECVLPEFPFERRYQIAHAERDWRVALNLAEAAKILLIEDPDVLLSAGAGPVVPFALLLKPFGRTRIVFIESAASVSVPSLTGRIMYRLADSFFYQWPTLEQFFPDARCASVVFR